MEALTHRRVLAIAWPIILSNAAVPLLGAVDTAVIGRLGEAAPLAAVGLGAVIVSSAAWVFGFLRMGTTGLTAQARGAGDGAEVAALLGRALILGVAGGLLLWALQAPLLAGAARLAGLEPEVERLMRDYVAIRLWSAPALVATFGITGWLIAQERTRAVLAIQMGTLAVNLGLDILFVPVLGWGVPGVAWATVLAELTGLAFGLWACRDAIRAGALRDRARLLDPVRLRRMLSVNADILIRTLALLAIFVGFQMRGAHFGTVALAANHLLMQMVNLAAQMLDGFAFATETLVGQAVGARRAADLRRGWRLAAMWGAGGAALTAAVFALAGPGLIALMSTAPEVREAAVALLPWVVIAPLVGLPSWLLDGIFLGATRSRDMRDMTLLAVALSLALAWPLSAIWGNPGLWAALNLSWALRAVTLAWRYPALERSLA